MESVFRRSKDREKLRERSHDDNSNVEPERPSLLSRTSLSSLSTAFSSAQGMTTRSKTHSSSAASTTTTTTRPEPKPRPTFLPSLSRDRRAAVSDTDAQYLSKQSSQKGILGNPFKSIQSSLSKPAVPSADHAPDLARSIGGSTERSRSANKSRVTATEAVARHASTRLPSTTHSLAPPSSSSAALRGRDIHITPSSSSRSVESAVRRFAVEDQTKRPLEDIHGVRPSAPVSESVKSLHTHRQSNVDVVEDGFVVIGKSESDVLRPGPSVCGEDDTSCAVATAIENPAPSKQAVLFVNAVACDATVDVDLVDPEFLLGQQQVADSSQENPTATVAAAVLSVVEDAEDVAIASKEELLDEAEEHGQEHDQINFVSAVEDAAQSLATSARLAFEVLGDVGVVAHTHYQRIIVFLPLSWQPSAQRIEPFLLHFARALELMIAVALVLLEIGVEVLAGIWRFIRPHRPDLLLFAAVGLALCTFGGFFPLTIAAGEAFGAVGFSTTRAALTRVFHDVHRAWKSTERTGQRSTTDNSSNTQVHDSTSDAQQQTSSTSVPNSDACDMDSSAASHTEHALRRLMLVFAAIDPERLMQALRGLSTGLVSICATLKSKHLRTLALGNAIAIRLEIVVGPFTSLLLPPSLSQWKPHVQRWIARLIALGIGWRLSQTFSAVNAAYRGGQICARYLLDYCQHRRLFSKSLRTAVWADFVLGLALCGLGIAFQLSFRLVLPFPFNILLWPLSVTELALTWTLHQTGGVLYDSVMGAAVTP